LERYKGTISNTAYMNKPFGRSGWSTGSLLNFCIGQGEILVTPIQVFHYTNLLATRGTANTPHLVSSVNKESENKIPLAPQIWDRITFDMGQVVSHSKGTGKNADPSIQGVDVYGKTGTAENPHGEDHAWFVGWVQYKERKVSIVVLLENSGSGGAVAAPVAKNVFNKIILGIKNSNQSL
jgi:Cell division protein FtsI/penicillin-binding protein 2